MNRHLGEQGHENMTTGYVVLNCCFRFKNKYKPLQPELRLIIAAVDKN